MPLEGVARVARRMAAVEGAIAASLAVAAGALTSAALTLVGVTVPAAAGLGLLVGLGAARHRWRSGSSRRGTTAAAAAIERVRPAANVIVTAEELQRHPGRAPAWIHRRVEEQAARHLAALEVSSIVPARRAQFAVAAGVLVVVAAFLLISKPRQVIETIERVQRAATALVSGPSAPPVRVTIVPPAYSGRPRVDLEDPARIEALEGSVILFQAGNGVTLRFGKDTFAGPFVARQDGYFALEGPSPGDQRLVPLAVTRDSAPAVRVEDPGKDLLLPAGGRTIPLRFSASDDLALETMELRYTKVSGSGEQFEFQEGRLPITLERVSAREWRGRGQLSLGDLRLEAGDSLVYRVIARDLRPGDTGLGSSDTYFVEITGPGQVAVEGVEMPPDMERYALSQQMIVLKLERLRTRETTMAREMVVEETAAIAAEQRAVRANFIFLMGGHVEDEEVEAEQSHEIQEGRLENTARRDINTAIGHMTRVEQGLAAVSTAAALPPARLAVDALQRAFGRSRYLLRSLSVRSRLDMSRRLTGDAAAARGWRRDPAAAEEHEVGPLVLFDDLLQAGRRVRNGEHIRVEEWQTLAESALRVDPASTFWQATSHSLSELATADAATVTGRLERVIGDVAPHARSQSLPGALSGQVRSPLSKAWQAENRR